MLNKNEKNNEINVIASGAVLDGNLSTKGDIRIDGHLKGEIKTDGRVVLGEKGVIEGQIFCKSAIISGETKATINSKDLLTLKSTAKLSGEIIAGKLAIEPGAIFHGKCSMGALVKNLNNFDSEEKQKDKEQTAS